MLVEVMPKVVEAFRGRVRRASCVPAVSSQREFKVFNILLAKIPSSARSLFPRDLGLRG